MSQTDTAHAWWSRLRHQGLLLSPVVMVERYPTAPPPAKFPALPKLRDARTRFESHVEAGKHGADRDQAAILGFTDALLDSFVGHTEGRLAKQGSIPENLTTVVRIGTRSDTIRPHRVVFADAAGTTPALLVMADPSPQVGRGRGRTVYSRFLELLRGTGHRLGLLTNGQQFRLVYAGLDFESWCEWESDRWFDEGEGTEELCGLRQLLSPESLKPVKEGVSGLLDGVEESRKRQADLSSVLRENVRQAVELLLEEVSTANRTKPELFALLVAHGEDRKLTDAEAHEAMFQATVRVVMRLVVCLFAESRQLLPVNDPIYGQSYGVRSLYELLDEVTRYEGGTHALFNRQTAWHRLMALFRLIYSGSAHGAFPMRAYGGVLFRPGDENSTDAVARALHILEHGISVGDSTIYYVLRKLLRGPLPVIKGKSKTFVDGPVDYTDLRTEFIGLIYEGLLDYRLKRTDEQIGPQIFLNLGREPVLPLARLEDMLANDKKGLKDLLTTLRKEKVTATAADEEEEAEEDADDADDGDEEATEEIEVEADEGVVAVQRTGDYLDSVEAAKRWASEAVVLAGLIGKQKAREPDSEYQAHIEVEATKLIKRVVATGEFYLVRAGNTRKGTGTFYTRPQLAVPTVHRTLEPLCYDKAADGTLTPKKPEDILALKVCDPACGSASFLVAALHYLTDALYKSLCHHRKLEDPAQSKKITLPYGRPRTNKEGEELVPFPPNDPQRGDTFAERIKALLRRHVVERCIYGVDINPLAVEFARVSLWVETLDPELPFSFLDHKIKVGNSLVGCWLDRVEDYPLKAWEREGGDGKDGPRTQRIEEFLKGPKVGNRRSGDGRIKKEMRQVIESRFDQQPRLFPEEATTTGSVVALARTEYEQLHDLPISDPDERERFYREHIERSTPLCTLKAGMDEWCAVWFWPTDEESVRHAPTPLTFHKPSIEKDDCVARVANEHRFFHWEVEFPDTFTPQRRGFDAIVGNPPWEILKPKSKEFFAEYDPLFRTYDKQPALKQMKSLLNDTTCSESWSHYLAGFKALSNWARAVSQPLDLTLARGSLGISLDITWKQHRESRPHFTLESHPFRLLGSADINSYKMFTELAICLSSASSHIGMVLPSSIHNDSGAVDLRSALLDRIDCLVKLDNESRFFAGLEHNSKFDVLVIGGRGAQTCFDAAFFKKAPISAVEQLQKRVLAMPHSLVHKVSPTTLSVPELYSAKSMEVLSRIYDAGIIPPNLAEFKREFDIANDSRFFAPTGDIPLYQGAMIWHFDHRYNFWVADQRKWHRAKLESVEIRHSYPIRPKSWVSFKDYENKYSDRKTNGYPDYFFYRIACRRQSSLSNQRTFVSTIIPRFVAATDSINLLLIPDLVETLFVCGLFNSLVYDFVMRTKITSNISKFYLEQMPYPAGIDPNQRKLVATACLRLCGTTKHFDQMRSDVSGHLGKVLSPCTQEWQRRYEKAIIDALSASMFGLSVDDFREVVRQFPLVDRHLPEEQRQPIIALRVFEALKSSGHLPEVSEGYEQEPVREFSNPWKPPLGWESCLIEDDGLLDEESWRIRYGYHFTSESNTSIEHDEPKKKDLFGNVIPTDLFGNEIRTKPRTRKKS